MLLCLSNVQIYLQLQIIILYHAEDELWNGYVLEMESNRNGGSISTWSSDRLSHQLAVKQCFLAPKITAFCMLAVETRLTINGIAGSLCFVLFFLNHCYLCKLYSTLYTIWLLHWVFGFFPSHTCYTCFSLVTFLKLGRFLLKTTKAQKRPSYITGVNTESSQT